MFAWVCFGMMWYCQTSTLKRSVWFKSPVHAWSLLVFCAGLTRTWIFLFKKLFCVVLLWHVLPDVIHAQFTHLLWIFLFFSQSVDHFVCCGSLVGEKDLALLFYGRPFKNGWIILQKCLLCDLIHLMKG